MAATYNVPDAALVGKHTHGFFEDFNYYIADDLFTATATDSGSVTETDAAGGVVDLAPSDSTAADNDEIYLHQSNETFLMASEKPFQFDCRIQFSEANTDDANVAVGLADAVAANLIVDNGAGVKTTMDGAVIWKGDGDTTWSFTTSNATTQTTTASTTTAGGSAYQVLTIICRHQDASNCRLIPMVDGVQLKDSNGNLIEHTVAYSGMAEMECFVGLKNGSTNEESLLVDYISCWQKR